MIPIFIITKDRLTCLKKAIESYKKLGDIELIFHDMGSTYPPLLDFLKKQKNVVYYQNRIGREGLSSVSQTIKDWFAVNEGDYYIVTDPDIVLKTPSEKILPFFKKLLDKFPKVKVVGSHVNVPSDLPIKYGHYDKLFWELPKEELDGIKYFQKSTIDTTFGMYRKSFTFSRHNEGIRVAEPCVAEHLGWFMDLDNEEDKYYLDNADPQICTFKRDK